MAAPAGQGEILRSVQKDDLYITRLSSTVASLGLDLLGPSTWVKLEKWCDPATRFLYYTLTTLSGYQTLGEEYTGLVQVVAGPGDRDRVPPLSRRFLMIFLQTFGPRILTTLCDRAVAELKNPANNLDPKAREALLELAVPARSVLTLVDRLNTAVFYYSGIFYHVAKRLTGVRYLRHGSSGGDQTLPRSSFRLLGHIASLHLLLTCSLSLYRRWNTTRTRTPASSQADTSGPSSSSPPPDSYVPPSERCSLCLDRLGTRGPPSATPCGHLFCWSCVLESVAVTGDCALCRQSVILRKIVPLQNY